MIGGKKKSKTSIASTYINTILNSCNKCSLLCKFAYVNNILDRAGKDAEAMEKGSEQNCIKYLEHYDKWLTTNHYNMVDIKIAVVQIIGSGGPHVIQGISDEELQLKIDYAKQLIELFKKIAPGSNVYLIA